MPWGATGRHYVENRIQEETGGGVLRTSGRTSKPMVRGSIPRAGTSIEFGFGSARSTRSRTYRQRRARPQNSPGGLGKRKEAKCGSLALRSNSMSSSLSDRCCPTQALEGRREAARIGLHRSDAAAIGGFCLPMSPGFARASLPWLGFGLAPQRSTGQVIGRPPRLARRLSGFTPAQHECRYADH